GPYGAHRRVDAYRAGHGEHRILHALNRRPTNCAAQGARPAFAKSIGQSLAFRTCDGLRNTHFRAHSPVDVNRHATESPGLKHSSWISQRRHDGDQPNAGLGRTIFDVHAIAVEVESLPLAV